MAVRNPLVLIGGQAQEIPNADTIRNPRPLLTRRLSWSNGGQGSGLSSYLSVTRTVTGASHSFRLPVRLPATTDRWRIKLRNYNSSTSSNGATPLTLDGVAFGAAAAPSAGGALTGNFSGSVATSIPFSSAAIPNDGSYLILDWVSASGTQFAEWQDFILALGFHAAASTTLLVGVGQCWYWSNTTSATTAATSSSGATSAVQFPPLDVVIEYETTNRKRAVIACGDSLPEGAQGVNYYLNGSANLVATPLHLGYLEQWAAQRDIMVQRHCLFASTAQTWANSGYTGWSRQDASLGQWDAAILAIGCNDIATGATFAALQGYYASVLTNMRAIVGSSVPLYAINIMAQSFTTGTNSKEYYRYQTNEWLAQKPAGVTHTVDFDSALRGWISGSSLATNALDLALSCDGIHPSRQGSASLAQTLAAVLS